jgi:PGF-CTERM protein
MAGDGRKRISVTGRLREILVGPTGLPPITEEGLPPPPMEGVPPISVTQRLRELVARQGSLIRVWMEYVAKGSGCCCGATISFMILMALLIGTSPLWMPAVRQASPLGGMPGFEAVFAVAGLLVVAYIVRRKKRNEGT